jgi:hypothetical protein
MQKRYCECGREIRVSFVHKGKIWKSIYWSLCDFSGSKVETCPNCGRRLDIDVLR